MQSTHILQAEEEYALTLCTFWVGERLFGIDTGSIREVLGRRLVERVPLAPCFIAGIVPYRGEVVAAVCGQALLRNGVGAGGNAHAREAAVLVLEEVGGRMSSGAQDRFALAVDRVGGVQTVDRRTLDGNPSTLEERGRWLFAGSFQTPDGLLVQLDARRLNPSRLAELDWLAGSMGAGAEKEKPCAS